MACQNGNLMFETDFCAWRILGGIILLLFLSYASVQEVRSLHWLGRVLVSEHALAAVGLATFCANTEWLLATTTYADFRTQSDISLNVVSRQEKRYMRKRA
jgi:hypothetical protein